MDTCIGNKYVELIDRTECIGNSLLKINTNFATLDTQLCTTDTKLNTLLNVSGILKLENGEPFAAVAGIDYISPGAPFNSNLDVTGNIASTGSLLIGGNAVLSQNVTIGNPIADSSLNFNGTVTIQTPSLKKGIQIIGNQINASPLVNTVDTLLINYTGYNGTAAYSRNLNVCDGKQSSMLYIDASNSRIGIKTTTPQATLHVVGDLKVDGNIVSNAPLNPNVTVNLSNLDVTGATEGQLLTYKNGAVRWSPLSITLPQQTFAGAGIKVYDTPGAWTWTCPAGVTKATIEMYGAGGGGSASEYFKSDERTSYTSDTVGGGGGGHAVYTITVVPGTTYNLYVGAGGNGGTVPQGWIANRNFNSIGVNPNYKGADGGDTWCAVGGLTITATGGKGGGTKKTFTVQTSRGSSVILPTGGDGGSVPIVSPYVGQGIGGVYKLFSQFSGTGSNGGYGGESGGPQKGGGTGIFSCGGVGGSPGSKGISDEVTTITKWSNNTAYTVATVSGWEHGSVQIEFFKQQYLNSNYDETLDSQWRNGIGYGGGGSAAREATIAAVRREDTFFSDLYYGNYFFIGGLVGAINLGGNSYYYNYSNVSYQTNGVSPSYYKGGKGANGAVIIRY